MVQRNGGHLTNPIESSSPNESFCRIVLLDKNLASSSGTSLYSSRRKQEGNGTGAILFGTTFASRDNPHFCHSLAQDLRHAQKDFMFCQADRERSWPTTHANGSENAANAASNWIGYCNSASPEEAERVRLGIRISTGMTNWVKTEHQV